MRALLLIDLQRDFFKGGALAVPHAEEILPVIHHIMPGFQHIFATKDWHPSSHESFKIWPPHCIQNTAGAAFVSDLHQERIEMVFYKGKEKAIDSYSAFFDEKKKKSTELENKLHELQIDTLYIAGVATEYCVFHTVLDALELGFKVFLIEDGCRAVDQKNGEKAIQEMRTQGACIIHSSQMQFPQ